MKAVGGTKRTRLEVLSRKRSSAMTTATMTTAMRMGEVTATMNNQNHDLESAGEKGAMEDSRMGGKWRETHQ